VDELVDDGIILETDPVIVASRVSKPPAQDMTSMKNIELSEQGFLNAWSMIGVHSAYGVVGVLMAKRARNWHSVGIRA
jgi:hypothetical protein